MYIYINQKILKGTRKTGRHSFPVFWGWERQLYGGSQQSWGEGGLMSHQLEAGNFREDFQGCTGEREG